MTEQEWLGCGNPPPMLTFMSTRLNPRNLRLFMVGYCRQNSDLLSNTALAVLSVAERFSDGVATVEELSKSNAHADGNSLCEDMAHHEIDLELDVPNLSREKEQHLIEELEHRADRLRAAMLVHMSADPNLAVSGLVGDLERMRSGQVAADLLRDILGNPFRPVAFDSLWRTPSVTGVARAIYDERRFADLPILADALEEAGCTNADILDHCRQPGEHVRGCWVVDLVLGRE